MTVRIVSPEIRVAVQRTAFACLALFGLALAVGAVRLVKARGMVSELKLGTTGRQARLRDNRKAAGALPKGPKPDALDRSRAVSKLRSKLSSLAAQKGFALDEFQAATDETPYLTVYATENNDPGWVQVSVRVMLRGHAPVLAAAVAELRTLDVPFEIDNLELTRRSADNAGVSTVTEQVQMRVLVYRGEA